MEPTVATVPALGAVNETVGCELATVTDTAADVTLVPVESSATAVSEYAPATDGVHAIVYGAVVTAAPICAAAPPEGVAKKVTEVRVAPSVGVADAVIVVLVPAVAVEFAAGAVMATLVVAAAVIVIAVEVTVLLLVSRTRAVMLWLPAVVGTQVSV